jgi:hypothetical protein
MKIEEHEEEHQETQNHQKQKNHQHVTTKCASPLGVSYNLQKNMELWNSTKLGRGACLEHVSKNKGNQERKVE